MTRLINDLLDITRVKHGRLRLERMAVDANEAAVAAGETVRQQAEAKSLTIEYDLAPRPLAVDADPERLAQILDNILRNAVNYTDAGNIVVTVRGDGTMANFAVADTGIGIEDEDPETLFEPYHQRREPARGGGLGLGLALVKGLVEAHGGIVGVHSAGRHKGSTFTFSMPLARVAPATVDTAPLEVPRSLRVLVVDDQRDVADMFGSLIETLGQRVRVVYDGAAALAVAREHQPDVAFLDVSMPDMSGEDVARELRQILPADRLTLVAVTGHERRYVHVEKGVFDQHLLKPATLDSIVAILVDVASKAPGDASTI
jgi:CheY-like chemotaxis protein